MKAKKVLDLVQYKQEKKLMPARVPVNTIEETQKKAKKLGLPLTVYVDLALREYNKKA